MPGRPWLTPGATESRVDGGVLQRGREERDGLRRRGSDARSASPSVKAVLETER
ncbi:uncharacterized, partial [Tachysurus ichikawai]